MDMYLDINQACKQNSKGFTLVELSIVIVIVGLIVAGVTAGKSLIASAKLRSVINEYNQYKTAIATFKMQYGKLPGDLHNATSYWTSGTDNGDGNNQVGDNASEPSKERALLWQHLALAKLIPGSYTGTFPGNVTTIGINVPRSAYPKAGWYYLKVTNYSQAYGIYLREWFIHAGSVGAPWHDHQAMSGIDGHTIDVKMDDGIPNKGIVIGARGWPLDGTAGRCVDQAGGSLVTVNYILSDKQPSCRMYFKL